MTKKTLNLIKEVVSKKNNEPIPRKKQAGKKEQILINPEYKPFNKNKTFRQPNDTGQ